MFLCTGARKEISSFAACTPKGKFLNFLKSSLYDAIMMQICFMIEKKSQPDAVRVPERGQQAERTNRKKQDRVRGKSKTPPQAAGRQIRNAPRGMCLLDTLVFDPRGSRWRCSASLKQPLGSLLAGINKAGR